MAVIGLGPEGLELGQALSWLGIEITGFTSGETIGGASDPEVNAVIRQAIAAEFPIHLGPRATVEPDGDTLIVRSGRTTVRVDSLLQMPFYHPTLEEAVRAALLDAAQKLHIGNESPLPVLCGSCPEPPLC